jgi:molecular chaperone GrpE
MAEPAAEQQPEMPPPGEGESAAATAAPDATELLTALQRERADFANYRRRTVQDRAADAERARAQQILDLMPILDDLDRAFAQVPDDLRENPWVRGIALSQRRMHDYLTRSGVEPIDAVGARFDPLQHEAVYFESRPDVEDQVVTSVVQPGYRLGGRVLRPAQVGVSGPVEGQRREAEASEAAQAQPTTDDQQSTG